MPSVKHRLERRRRAARTIDHLRQHYALVNVIHYSCESFYDQPLAGSRRITSIAVRHAESAQTQSFSIQLEAERQGVASDEIASKFDNLETAMLTRFYAYLKQKRNFYWIHWNMRNVNYGFAALEHRYLVLKQRDFTVTTIDDSKLIDLSTLLSDVYGPHYAQDPRMMHLFTMNGISKRDILAGEQEAQAFKDCAFLPLHQSTLAKVDALTGLFNRLLDDNLKTGASWSEIYGSRYRGIAEAVTDSTLFKILGLIAIPASIIGVPLAILSLM
jgi:hypothetical protein